MEQFDPYLFTWSRWRIGSPVDVLGIECREECLTSPKSITILRSKAVGFCKGESLVCRPKEKVMAVMFWIGEKSEIDDHWWFHFRLKEFKKIWPEIKG